MDSWDGRRPQGVGPILLNKTAMLRRAWQIERRIKSSSEDSVDRDANRL